MGEKAASICWKVDNYLGGTDSKKYTIGIKDTLSNLHSVVNIKIRQMQIRLLCIQHIQLAQKFQTRHLRHQILHFLF